MSVTVEQPARLSRAHFHGPCAVGAFTYFAGKADVHHATIGRFCSIAPDVIIGPGEHPIGLLSTHPFAFGGGDKRFKKSPLYQQIRAPGASIIKHRQTTIGSDVWIGARAYIAQGVTIGHGAVIAAHAVVTRDVEPYAVVAGMPARVIRMRFEPAIIQRLLELKWWERSMSRSDVGDLPFDDVNACIEMLSAVRDGANSEPARYSVRKCAGRWYQRWWQMSAGTKLK